MYETHILYTKEHFFLLFCLKWFLCKYNHNYNGSLASFLIPKVHFIRS